MPFIPIFTPKLLHRANMALHCTVVCNMWNVQHKKVMWQVKGVWSLSTYTLFSEQPDHSLSVREHFQVLNTWKYWHLCWYFSWFLANKIIIFHNKRPLLRTFVFKFWQNHLLLFEGVHFYKKALIGSRLRMKIFFSLSVENWEVCVFGCVIWWAHKAEGQVWPKLLQ